MQGILEKLQADAAQMPNRPVYDFLDCAQTPFAHDRVTMGQLYRRAMDLAAELRRRGAKPGDRAIILSLQDAGTVYAVWGCMLAGVVFTVIPPPIDEGKLTRFISVLRSCKPKFLISNEGMEKESGTNVTGPLLRRAFRNVVSLKRIYTDKVEPGAGPDVIAPHKGEDPLYLQYTSGSTSDPKGVMVTYGNLMNCISQCLELFDFQHTSNNLASWVPFYHEQGVPLPMDAVTVFSLPSAEGERPVLCAECAPEADYPALTAQINRLAAQHFGFSFFDVVFVKQGTLPRTDNRKIKTLDARTLYQQGRLDVLYTSAGGQAGSAAPVTAPPRGHVRLPARATPEEIQPVIQELFESLLPNVRFGPDDSFLELGGDSLRMMELVCGLENDLGVPVDLRRIAATPTVAGISAYLSSLLNGTDALNQTDLRRECVLPEDIRPKRDYIHRPEESRNVFLTGSTGFLGAYLIRALIRQREKQGVRIYCHVRAASREKAMERIVSNMEHFACWDERYRSFLIPVPGDLNKPRLGMDEATWAQLSQEIDLIIHNGAVLNFVFPYDQLKRTNVLGTVECLRLACAGRAKYFHYVSSYSVFDNPSHFDKPALESDPLESPEGYFLGYSETKWVAEKLVDAARQRGLRTAIYRPGDITGTQKDGIWNLGDLVSRSLVGCIQLGCVPDMQVNLHLTPVDYVAEAIVCIAFQSASTGLAFHLINHSLMPLDQISDLLGRAGYPVKVLPYEEWCRRLTACTSQENALRILSCLFTDQRLGIESLPQRFGPRQAQFDTRNADRLLASSGIQCPPVHVALIRSYLRYFQRSGDLPAPAPLWRRLFSPRLPR